MGKPEATVEDYLCAGIVKRGGWAAKVVDKGRRGAPDRELRFPKGKIVYVETKAKDGRLKKWQVEYQKDLRDLGFLVFVLWTIEHIDTFFWRFDKGTYE